MKTSMVACLALGCAVIHSAGLMADTVTIDPGNGVATNVTERIVGAVDVVVNSGSSGGGIATLNPHNTYTGTTTIGCGTLVATALGGADGSSVGATSAMTIGPGTLRYSGPAGGVLSVPVTSTVSETAATIVDTSKDMELSGGYTQTDGAFIKTGAGTLTVSAGENLLQSSGKTSIAYADTVKALDLNDNGDAPTQGYAGFTVAEGTFSITGGTNTLGANRFAQVGVQGTDAASAVLEFAGGENFICTPLVVCPPRNVEGSKAGVRITGGSTTLGNGQSFFLGCHNNAYISAPGDYEAFLEMTGGTFEMPGSGQSLFVGQQGKGKISIDISGGEFVIGKNFGFAYNDTAGLATNTASLTVRDGAVLNIGKAMYVGTTAGTDSSYEISVLDGGKISVPQTYRATSSDTANPQCSFLIDGGILECTGTNTITWLPDTFTSGDILIGSKGATFCAVTSTLSRITAALTATNSVPGMTPAGVTFAKSRDCDALIALSTAGAWAGPTTVSDGMILRLYNSGALPSSSDVTIDGTLEVTASGTVAAGGSLTVNGSVKLYTGATLSLNGPISGDGKILLYSNTGLSAISWTGGNTYPIVTAPLSAKSSLEAFAKNCYAGVNPGNSKCILMFNVTDDGTTATLSMKYATAPTSSTDGDVVLSGSTSYAIARLFVDAGYGDPVPKDIKARSFTLEDGDLTIFNEPGVKVGQLPKSKEESGRLESKVTINGGTFHVPGNFSMSLENADKEGYCTLLVNGGNLEIAGNLHPNYIPTASTQTNTVTLNSGTISCNYLRCSAGTSTGTYLPAIITLNGGTLTAANPVDLCHQSAAASADAGSFLYVNSGATLATPRIEANQSGQGTVYFDGGTVQVLLASGIDSYVQKNKAVYVGAGGVTFDMSKSESFFGTSKYINLKQPFLRNPDLGDAEDGGITITGLGGMVLCGSGFAGSTITGPITVENFGTLMMHNYVTDNKHDIVIKPTGIFRQYQNGVFPEFASMTLGEAGASSPVVLNVYRSGNASVPMAKVTGALSVLSPVYVGVSSAYNSSLSMDAAGVYTTLVYKAASSSVDVSMFHGYPTDGMSASFEIADSEHDGYKAVVMTVTKGTSESGLAVYSKSGGEWSLSSDVKGLNRLLSASTGASVAMDTAIDEDFNGILYVNAEQIEENRGTSGAVAFGDGALASFAGTLYPRSGTVSIPSLSWMTDASQLRLGFGTVKYTGTGETIPGFYTHPTEAFESTLEIENDLTVNGTTKCGDTGSFMKSGAGTLTFAGTGDYLLGNNHNWTYDTETAANNNACANGDSATNATVNLSVAAGKLVVGSSTDSSSAPQVRTTAYAAIGVPTVEDESSEAEVEVNSGSLTVEKHDLIVGYYSGLTRHTHPKLTINGGTVTINEKLCMNLETLDNDTRKNETRKTVCSPEVVVNGGELNVRDNVAMSLCFAPSATAVSESATSKFTINGGTVSVGGNFCAVSREGKSTRAPFGLVTLNGGTLDVTGNLDLCRNSKTTGTVWLNAGATLKADAIVSMRGGGVMYFNGGVYAPYATSTNELADTTQKDEFTTSFYVSEGGAVIDTSNVAQGSDYVVSAALKHDAELGDAVDGGLVKRGSGTLVLTGANTYTGTTVVEEGTLRASALPGGVDVAYGATFDVDGDSISVSSLAGTGTIDGSVVVTGTFAASDFDNIPYITGNLSTSGKVTVDTGDVVPTVGTYYALAEVAGDVDVKLRRPSASSDYTFVPVEIGGILYARVSNPAGMILILR